MDRIVVIGAGIGGLAAAMRLAHAGAAVTVLDIHDAPGGKMRTVPCAAGPVDAGPTVLTLRPFFERLFHACGTTLDAHVTLKPLDILARHRWRDGATFDLHPDFDRSRDAVASFAGKQAAKDFTAFHTEARALFEAFEAPMMRAPDPTPLSMAAPAIRNPRLIPRLASDQSLERALARRFSDPRLAQLFARYATYVGGDPAASPALLSLIYYAEAQGVWVVDGGMHRLACAMRAIAEARGASFRFGTRATEILHDGDRITGVGTETETLPADRVVFNGDPNALRTGLLGEAFRPTIPKNATEPRSLSAYVWSFAAQTQGHALAHHNVYFADTPSSEFADIARGALPTDPTLYLCAQDSEAGRFEIIINGPPRPGTTPDPEEAETCRKITFDRLEAMGLRITPRPTTDHLTTPEDFNRMFPASMGSLYGLSPHGTMAAFRRPRVRTTLPGLYLAGGGAHPGAGIPMAATSGLHAAEAILQDLASTSASRRTAMRGGMSTASAQTAAARSRSSPS